MKNPKKKTKDNKKKIDKNTFANTENTNNVNVNNNDNSVKIKKTPTTKKKKSEEVKK